ncbi:MAG: hypothetical protein ABL918_07815 [Chakrabartia sp.]
MDRFGSFDRDYDEETNDVGVDAPPAIGTDERRMHVRAYNYWVSLLDGRAYPSIEDLEPDNLEDFGPHSVLLDFSTGAASPAVAFLGESLRTECDLPADIASVADVPSRSLLSRLTDHYLQIIANRAPIGFEAEFVNQRGNNTMYRGILMPFSSDDDTIDFIYGVINWKEVADEALSDEISGAVDHLLNTAPPRVEAPVSVWADRPIEAAGYDNDDYDDDDTLELSTFAPDGSEELGDWLAAARDSANVAKHADSRSRLSLYKALGLAYDFATIAAQRPEDYAQLLDDSGIKPQARAPMTPIVKLVFGADYDKTRLAEFATTLSYAARQNLQAGELMAYLEQFPGGIKGVVSAERSERRPERKVRVITPDLGRARKLPTIGVVELAGDEEFVVLVARRVDAGHVAVIGSASHDDILLDRALRGIDG